MLFKEGASLHANETRILTLHGLHLSEDVQICYYPELHLSDEAELNIETVNVEVVLWIAVSLRWLTESFTTRVAMHHFGGCVCV